MRDVYIINPKAGKKNTAVFFMERAKAFHAAHGGDYALCLTQREGLLITRPLQWIKSVLAI